MPYANPSTSSQTPTRTQLCLDCGDASTSAASASRRWRDFAVRRALELDLVAFGIVEIDRRAAAFRTVALHGFAQRNAERRKLLLDRIAVERFDAEAEVIHVAAAWRPLALYQVEQR